MNKSKKELYEENKKLKEQLASMEDFYGLEEIITYCKTKTKWANKLFLITMCLISFVIGVLIK